MLIQICSNLDPRGRYYVYKHKQKLCNKVNQYANFIVLKILGFFQTLPFRNTNIGTQLNQTSCIKINRKYFSPKYNTFYSKFDQYDKDITKLLVHVYQCINFVSLQSNDSLLSLIIRWAMCPLGLLFITCTWHIILWKNI